MSMHDLQPVKDTHHDNVKIVFEGEIFFKQQTEKDCDETEINSSVIALLITVGKNDANHSGIFFCIMFITPL